MPREENKQVVIHHRLDSRFCKDLSHHKDRLSITCAVSMAWNFERTLWHHAHAVV